MELEKKNPYNSKGGGTKKRIQIISKADMFRMKYLRNVIKSVMSFKLDLISVNLLQIVFSQILISPDYFQMN